MLEMKLRPERTDYRAGELPNLEVSLRNTRPTPVRLLAYMLDYRLKAAMVAQNEGRGASYELQPFRSVEWQPARPGDVLTLQPGADWTHRLEWTDRWEFGWIQRHSQPPIVTPGYRLKGFPAGSYRFSTGLFARIGIYRGADGVFDHRLEGKRLPDEIPGSSGWGAVETPDLETEVLLTFS